MSEVLEFLFSQEIWDFVIHIILLSLTFLSNDVSEDQGPTKRLAKAIPPKDYARFPQQTPENEYVEEVIEKKVKNSKLAKLRDYK